MAKVYRPVHLEEEESLRVGGVDEKWTTCTLDSRESVLDRLRSLSPHWAWALHAVLLSISMGFFAFSFCVRSPEITDAAYTEKYSAWSPALEAVKYETQHFDLPPVANGPFIGKGPDVDAAWEFITDSMGDNMISEEEMEKLGLDPAGALQIVDPDGRPGYRVAIEVFHQLHCLNLLRQDVYKDHYKPLGGDTADDPHHLRGHLDHCIDALRQFVMCQADVGVFSFRFPFGDGDPWPDYSTPHTCRNYEAVRQWAVDHTVPQAPGEPDH